MTRITVEIPQGQDAEFLLTLLRRLNYRVIQKPDKALTTVEKSTEATHSSDLPDAWVSIVKPMRQSQSIEDMIQEQNYQGFDRAAFDQIINELDIEDAEGELLKLLRA